MNLNFFCSKWGSSNYNPSLTHLCHFRNMSVHLPTSMFFVMCCLHSSAPLYITTCTPFSSGKIPTPAVPPVLHPAFPSPSWVLTAPRGIPSVEKHLSLCTVISCHLAAFGDHVVTDGRTLCGWGEQLLKQRHFTEQESAILPVSEASSPHPDFVDTPDEGGVPIP